ncbi:MAG: heme ABC exporter ATP-binding protein CcmA [Pseudomonadota bacterium]
MGALTVKNLRCVRGAVPIFEGVSLTLAAGTALQVFGNNGTGKSTLLQVLAGLVPGEGEIVWVDETDTRQPLLPTQLVFQGHAVPLKPKLTVEENLIFWQRCYRGRADRPALMGALETVGLTALGSEPAHVLSAGQRRRLGLARCLLAGRSLWLLDEPTAALDRAGRALVADVCCAHLAGGGFAIIATHDPIDVPAMQLTLAPQDGECA